MSEHLIIPESARLTREALARVASRAVQCDRCERREWRLCKWQKGNGWSIDIQCVECGISGKQPFPKAEHPRWAGYPEFDKTHSERWKKAWMAAFWKDREEQSAALSAEYAEWLATSPEWAAMHRRIMDRASGYCEACLERPATQVHHLSYDLGWLPPAYLLIAICRPCHTRLSVPDENDDWSPRKKRWSVGREQDEESKDGI